MWAREKESFGGSSRFDQKTNKQSNTENRTVIDPDCINVLIDLHACVQNNTQ